MSDKSDGDDKKRGGKFGPRKSGGGRPGFDKGGDRPRSRAPRAAEGGETPYRGRAQRKDSGAEGGAKPFRSRGPRPEGQTADDGGKPFRGRAPRTETRGEGGAKPFRPSAPRGDDRATEGGGERPRRSFGKDGERPRAFAKREEGGEERPRRSFAKDGERPSGPRRERGTGDDKATARPRRAAEDGEESGGAMRIAKRLARAGIASRRDAEGMIADGRVRLNGHLVETPAVTVTMADRIEIDGEPLPAAERTRLWLFHKPAGIVTTNRDPEGRPTVFDRLPDDLPRVLTVGRLDINTEGLLLLTNDGGLSRTLELPATGWLRRYRVRAHGKIDQAQLDDLKHGIAVDGVFYGAIEATLDSQKGSNVWMTLGLREGKNREVKRVLGHLGLEVNRLIRLSFGPFQLGDLPEGAVREIKGRTLRDQLGERLIEESGADFDSPILNPFTNEVVEPGTRRAPSAPTKAEPADKPASRRFDAPATDEWVSSKVEAKPSRKAFGQAKRESALSRLDTKPRREAGGARPFKPKRPREDEAEAAPARPKPGARRNANVWIAPGGRPLGEKKAAELKAREAERAEGGDKPLRSRGFRDRPDGAPASADGDKPRRSAGFRQQSTGRSFGEREERGGKSGFKPGGTGPKGAGGKRPGGGGRPRRDG
ncbi:pseudouridine synthase [Aureimonas endophytica]|uniref:Pseudouridine synthase n=1 Tax=Aureimonas endophytica TaxID=2027858 RepID=A0A916ZI90_9HYPH|nr:pseudouridine synthase [Aureimonas endophytica]GGD99536.1 pseudouridine synthase [Aureimonas endophytica]